MSVLSCVLLARIDGMILTLCWLLFIYDSIIITLRPLRPGLAVRDVQAAFVKLRGMFKIFTYDTELTCCFDSDSRSTDAVFYLYLVLFYCLRDASHVYCAIQSHQLNNENVRNKPSCL